MSDRRQVDAEIGARWGAGSVVIDASTGDAFRAPLPAELAPLTAKGHRAVVYLGPDDRLDGWALPDERVGVRMDDDASRRSPSPATLDCRGRCQTIWYVVKGGAVSPDDGCLACGDPVEAA